MTPDILLTQRRHVGNSYDLEKGVHHEKISVKLIYKHSRIFYKKCKYTGQWYQTIEVSITYMTRGNRQMYTCGDEGFASSKTIINTDTDKYTRQRGKGNLQINHITVHSWRPTRPRFVLYIMLLAIPCGTHPNPTSRHIIRMNPAMQPHEAILPLPL